MQSKKVLSLLFLISSDCLVILFSFYLAFTIRSAVLPPLFPSLYQRPVFWNIYFNHSFSLLVWVAVFFYEKLYTKRLSIWDETKLILKSNTIAFIFIISAIFITNQYFIFSRLIIVTAWLFSTVFLPVSRKLTKNLLSALKLWTKKVMVISSDKKTPMLIETIQSNKTQGFEIMGCLTGNREDIGKEFSGVKILDHYDNLEFWKNKTHFRDLIVNLPDITGDELINHLKKWDELSETIHYIPRTGDIITTGVEIENIGKILSLTLRKNLHKPWNILIKAVFEFFLSTLFLIVLSPVFLIIAAAIKIDSRGTVFFIQERFGKNSRRIKIIKFRSMYHDADKKLARYLRQNAQAKEEWRKYKKLKNHDPRVTKAGKFLRKYSLDELPQFINVLKGDMSIVGPRPYIVEELTKVKTMKSLLLQVKPGITGLWQISGRSAVPFQDRLWLDEYYLRNWSLWLDIVILLKTIRVFLSGEGAF
jgi:Undecaprenyl-phosphate galactose phosphotransferase WbaP